MRACGDTRVPSVSTTAPSTLTQPFSIHSSASRREHRPSSLIRFDRRGRSGCSPRAGPAGAVGGGDEGIGDAGFGNEDRRCRAPEAGAPFASAAGFARAPEACRFPGAAPRFARSAAPDDGAVRRASGEEASARPAPDAPRLRRRTPASGVAAGAGTGGGAGVAAAAEGALCCLLACCARQAREVSAFGAAAGSTGLVILRMGRAMGEGPTSRRIDNLAS